MLKLLDAATEHASLMVHCSMSSLGRVQGGAQTIVEALIQSVGEQVTLVMPTLTDGRSDPSEWRKPPVAEELWSRIRYEQAKNMVKTSV